MKYESKQIQRLKQGANVQKKLLRPHVKDIKREVGKPRYFCCPPPDLTRKSGKKSLCVSSREKICWEENEYEVYLTRKIGRI